MPVRGHILKLELQHGRGRGCRKVERVLDVAVRLGRAGFAIFGGADAGAEAFALAGLLIRQPERQLVLLPDGRWQRLRDGAALATQRRGKAAVLGVGDDRGGGIAPTNSPTGKAPGFEVAVVDDVARRRHGWVKDDAERARGRTGAVGISVSRRKHVRADGQRAGSVGPVTI